MKNLSLAYEVLGLISEFLGFFDNKVSVDVVENVIVG